MTELTDKRQFLVRINNNHKLLRLFLVLLPYPVLMKLLAAHFSFLVTTVLAMTWVMFSGWLLVFHPNQQIEVYADHLLYKSFLISKEKSISFAEIRNAYFIGFFFLRYLVLADNLGKPILRLESDMENLDRFTAYLREKQIVVKESRERTH